MHIIIIIFTFIALYNPPLIRISFLHLTTIIAIIDYCKHKGEYDKTFDRSLFNLWLKILLVLLYLFIIILFSGNDFISPLYRVGVINFEMIPTSCFIVYQCKRRKYDLIDIIIKAALIQGIICVITMFIPAAQSYLVHRMVSNGLNDKIISFSSYRFYGISYSTIFSMPILNSIISVIALYKAIKKHYIYFVYSLIIALSAIVNARISIVSFFISAVFMFVIIFRDKKDVLKRVAKLCVISLSLLVLSYLVMKSMGSRFSNTIDWIERGIKDIYAIMLSEDNGGAYYSYYRGTQKWQLPNSFFSILFGTGARVIRGNYIYKSDIGYINDIWLGGIVYCALIYGFYFSVCKKIGKRFLMKVNIRYTGIVLTLIFLIINVKGSIFGNNEFISFVILLFALCQSDYFDIQREYIQSKK